MYWEIGKTLSANIVLGNKADYGKNIIGEIGSRLSAEYGKNFGRSSISRMMNFYIEFPDYEIVATLSQQLTWSHFVELLPIQDELKRNSYATMSKNENWSVRTLKITGNSGTVRA